MRGLLQLEIKRLWRLQYIGDFWTKVSRKKQATENWGQRPGISKNKCLRKECICSVQRSARIQHRGKGEGEKDSGWTLDQTEMRKNKKRGFRNWARQFLKNREIRSSQEKGITEKFFFVCLFVSDKRERKKGCLLPRNSILSSDGGNSLWKW